MKLKICGLKFKDNIVQVAALKPDYIGFIFYPKSKRFVGEDFQMPALSPEIKKTGVFVNASPEYVKLKVEQYKLDMVQLHGDETPEYCQQIRSFVKVMKAFGIDEHFDFKALELYKNCCDYFLFDTKTSEYGGSGKQFNWDVLKKYDNSVPFFLSGGLGLEEIEKLQITNYKLNIIAVDVNSRFEIEPGLKDVKKLKQVGILLQNNM